jgi:hypothetical protein
MEIDMSKEPSSSFDPRRPRIVYPPQRRRPKRRRFRWALVLVPLVILLALQLVPVLGHFAFSWEQAMSLLGVHDRSRYGALAVVGVLIVAIVALVRIFSGGPQEKKDDE